MFKDFMWSFLAFIIALTITIQVAMYEFHIPE